MKPRKARKPRDVIFECSEGRKIKVARVHQDFYGEQFGSEVFCDKDVILFDEKIFEGFEHEDQSKIARKLAKFFEQYADWIEGK